MTTLITAIIVEDEKRNAEVLSNLLTEYCDNVEVLAMAQDVPSAAKLIKEHNPDVIFLDIELPGASGFSLLDYFDTIDFEIVFTTAYNQYAQKAFEISALDYLLKPVGIKALQNAIKKVREQKGIKDMKERYEVLKLNTQMNRISRISLPTMEGLLFLRLDEVIRCEGDNNYTTFFLQDKTKVVVSKTLGDYESLLAMEGFYRAHRSHLVNLAHVRKFIRGRAARLVMDDNSEVEVSTRKRDDLLIKLAGNKA